MTTKKLAVPNTYVLIVLFIVFAVILTYIVPPGEFDLIKNEETGKSLVDPNSFHSVERNPAGLDDFLLSLPEGMKQGASIIFLVFLVGGFFQVINDTGAVEGAINISINKLGNRKELIIPIIMALLALLGALGIVVNAVIAFIPIGVMLAKKLKADPIVGISIMYLGSYAGFTASPVGPFNTLIGQNIAGLEPMSGFLLRLIVCLCLFAVSVWYVMRYTNKVQKDINKSVLDEIEWISEDNVGDTKFSFRHGLVLLTVIIGFVGYAYGSYKLKWGLNYMSAMMFAVAILSGIIMFSNPNDMAKSFIKGSQRMVYGALVIGFAKCITIILTDGNVIHSIIHYLTIPLTQIAPVFSALGMFVANLIFNFVVPSGSGQAMIVMPLMAPMADVVGVSRQVAVSAYQYGDGFSNIIIPTSGVLMAILGLAKVPYEKWLKFVMPLFLMWTGIGAISIIIGVLIGWS